jgi:hypothetical protein
MEKQSWEVKLVGKAVAKLINDEIGYRENHWFDVEEDEYNKTYGITNAVALIETITNDMLKAETLDLENSRMVITKEIRFLGKDRIKGIVAERILKDYMNAKWVFPHDFQTMQVVALAEKAGE